MNRAINHVLVQWDADGRVCNSCDNHKLWKEFGLDKRGVNGRQGICKECRRTDMAERRANPILGVSPVAP